MKIDEAISILESNGFGAEIANKKLRKMLDDAGFSDVHLIKGDGYFYVVADDDQHSDWLNALDSTAIYQNSFGQQPVESWFQDIISMIRQGRKKFMDSHADEEVEPEAPTGPTKLRLVRRDESMNESMTTDEIEEFISNAVAIAASKLEDDFWTYNTYNGAYDIKRAKGTVKEVYEIMRDMYELENVTAYHYVYKNKKRIADDELFSIHISEFNTEEELAEYIINQIQETKLTNVSEKTTNSKYVQTVNEDFGIGVGGMTGADQGIPQGGDCKAVPMMRLGDPAPYGKIQKLNHNYIGAEPFWRRSDMTIGKIKKKKRKKISEHIDVVLNDVVDTLMNKFGFSYEDSLELFYNDESLYRKYYVIFDNIEDIINQVQLDKNFI